MVSHGAPGVFMIHDDNDDNDDDGGDDDGGDNSEAPTATRKSTNAGWRAREARPPALSMISMSQVGASELSPPSSSPPSSSLSSSLGWIMNTPGGILILSLGVPGGSPGAQGVKKHEKNRENIHI